MLNYHIPINTVTIGCYIYILPMRSVTLPCMVDYIRLKHTPCVHNIIMSQLFDVGNVLGITS